MRKTVAQMSFLTSEQLASLAKVDSPTVANVIELFDVRSYVKGFTDHTVKAVYPELPPVVGYAVTATFRAGQPSGKEDAYGGMPQLIEESLATPGPRIAVIQDLDGSPKAATYGEVMASSFQTFGFTGLITSGAARDIEQVRRLRFPCWASSVIVAHGYCRFIQSQVPVQVAGLEVQPNDLIHADGNGIVHIPHSIAPAVADLCEPFMQAEQIVLDYLHSSKPTPEGYREAFQKTKAAIAHLRARAHAFLQEDRQRT
jgi:regulator of RNase E activity RraA